MKIASKIVVITTLLCSTLAFANCPPVNDFRIHRPALGVFGQQGNICTYVWNQPIPAGAGLINNNNAALKSCVNRFKAMLTDPGHKFYGCSIVGNQCHCRIK